MRDIANPFEFSRHRYRKCSRWQMTTDLIRLGAAWKRDKMPGTVTGFESTFSRFPRTLETVISPYKQEYWLKIDREESQFKFLSSNFFGEFTLVVNRCDPLVIRPGFVIFYGFRRQEKCLCIPTVAHVISTIHRSKAVSSLVLYEAFLLDIISFYTP